jgi:hypothetical protein
MTATAAGDAIGGWGRVTGANASAARIPNPISQQTTAILNRGIATHE